MERRLLLVPFRDRN